MGLGSELVEGVEEPGDLVLVPESYGQHYVVCGDYYDKKAMIPIPRTIVKPTMTFCMTGAPATTPYLVDIFPACLLMESTSATSAKAAMITPKMIHEGNRGAMPTGITAGAAGIIIGPGPIPPTRGRKGGSSWKVGTGTGGER